MRALMRLVIIGMIAGGLVQTAHSQETEKKPGLQISGTIKIEPLSITGLVVGKIVKVDEAFGQKHDVPVHAPFSFLVPTADDILELADFAPKPGQAFIKINFATPDRQLIENLQFVTANVDMGDLDERVQAFVNVLVQKTWPQVVAAGGDENKRDVVRQIKIGPYDAVEVIGRFMEPNLGLFYTRIVGILNPDSAHCVMAVANVVANYQELATPEDFATTRGGVALSRFKFLNVE